MAVSQARPASTTSGSVASARSKVSVPHWATMCVHAATSSPEGSGIGPMGLSCPACKAACTRSTGTSLAMVARRKDQPRSCAISHSSFTVARRWGAAPAVPALPMSKGTPAVNAAPSTRARSRRTIALGAAISPEPR